MTTFATVNDKKRPLASGGHCRQLCGSGNGGRQWQRLQSLLTVAIMGLI
jgi:hypothetical protein